MGQDVGAQSNHSHRHVGVTLCKNQIFVGYTTANCSVNCVHSLRGNNQEPMNTHAGNHRIHFLNCRWPLWIVIVFCAKIIWSLDVWSVTTEWRWSCCNSCWGASKRSNSGHRFRGQNAAQKMELHLGTHCGCPNGGSKLGPFFEPPIGDQFGTDVNTKAWWTLELNLKCTLGLQCFPTRGVNRSPVQTIRGQTNALIK